MSKVRADIQFLRGVAVLLVVVFHAFPATVSHGYLGVDVFFVISGFLVTKMILTDLDEGRFSLLRFYLRRARRLLPATYSTFVATTLLSYAFLTSVEWHAYLSQLLGGLAFAANFILYSQTGYFEAKVGTKPLLHIWSLSVEEQFYFAAPFLLWLAPGRSRGVVLLVAALASFVLCAVLVAQPEYQSFAFYMLPTRAWELLIGSLCASAAIRYQLWVPVPVRWAALGAILAVCFFGFDAVSPRFDALAVAVATAILMMAEGPWLPTGVAARAIERVGDWSYSLYLVHWPLFSFAFLATLGSPRPLLRAALVPIALVLAWLQYRFVETPFRQAPPKFNFRLIAPLGAGLAAVVLVAIPAAIVTTWPAGPDYFRILSQTRGFAFDCGESGLVVPFKCATSPMPELAIVGDSNAMYVAAGLLASGEPFVGSFVQITKSACPPVPGVAQLPEGESIEGAHRCARFGQSALDAILASRSIKTVVISSAFSQVILKDAYPLLVDDAVAPWSSIAIERLAAATRAMQASGKAVLLVAPVPWAKFDPAECNLRAVEHVVTVGAPRCDFNVKDIQRSYRQVEAALRDIASATGAKLLVPSDAICVNDICRTKIGANFVYRDGGHLTNWGAAIVMREMGLVDAVSNNPQ